MSHRNALTAALAMMLALTIAVALPTRAEASSQNARVVSSKPAKPPAKLNTDTRVYLLRGLLNVFSLGMDSLQERLSAMGFTAEVFNHNSWISIANQIRDDRQNGYQGAIVLIGHSLGADVLFELTERLEKDKVPVRLVVFFDPTISHEISKNVEHVLNLYQLNGFGRKVLAPKGFKGELVNMDLSSDASIGHGSIDKSSKLHDVVVAKIVKVAAGPQRKRRAPAKPVAAAPQSSASEAGAKAGQPGPAPAVPPTPATAPPPASAQPQAPRI